VRLLWKGLRAAGERVGRPPPQAKDEAPRQVVGEAVGSVANNRDKMK
jgi:hypothetical protein